MNDECNDAIAALGIAGIDQQQATAMVAALHPVLPEATAEDLTQIVLSSSVLRALRNADVHVRVPDEFKSLIPQLTTLLRNSKLTSWLGLR